jgi:hypothetical protein
MTMSRKTKNHRRERTPNKPTSIEEDTASANVTVRHSIASIRTSGVTKAQLQRSKKAPKIRNAAPSAAGRVEKQLRKRIDVAQNKLDQAAQRLREIHEDVARTSVHVTDEVRSRQFFAKASTEDLKTDYREVTLPVAGTRAVEDASWTSGDMSVPSAALRVTDEVRGTAERIGLKGARVRPLANVLHAAGADHARGPVPAADIAKAREMAVFAVMVAVLAAAMLLWRAALPTIDPNRMTDLGLVSILPPAFHLSLLLLCTGFAWQVAYRRVNGVVPYLYLVSLVVILHATPPLVYGTLRYSWAWKHLGIVDYIQRHGEVDPSAPFLAAYHNWPGLFVVTAWIADLLGARAMDLASAVQFTPVVLNTALLAAFVWLLQLFTHDKRLLLTASWIFVVANWIGQDYFSPQGVTFLLYVVLLGLFLGPLRRSESTFAVRRPRLLNVLGPIACPAGLKPRRVGQLPGVLSALLALAIILVIVVTHQLTPLLVILSACTLVALGWIVPSYLAFTLVAEAVWLLWGAAPFVYLQLHSEIAAVGDLSEATSKLASAALVSSDRAWVVWAGRMLSAMIVLAGLYGGLRRLLWGYWDLTAVALLLSPAPLLAVAYGGESVFRVYLFSLPFLAFFAAAVFFPSPHCGRPAIVFPVISAACMLSSVGLLIANDGKDREYRFTPDEVAASEWLYSTAPAGSLLIEGARSYPSQFLNYENFSYLPISEESAGTKERIVNDPEGVLARWMSNPRWTDAYLILTRSQRAYLEAGGYMRPGDFARIENALLASPRFRVVHASPNVRVFKLLSLKPSRHGK